MISDYYWNVQCNEIGAEEAELESLREALALEEAEALPEPGPEDWFDEYGDLDAIACANGDYNTLEENELFAEGFDEF